ncbi:hypothetical protein ABIF86_000615 [Bradyrhizobium japonicum]
MKPLSDTCRDKALAVSSSPFFYSEGDKSRLKDAFHCGVSLKGGFGSRASVSKTKDGCG